MWRRVSWYSVILLVKINFKFYAYIAWPGGVREGRAAFATVSALPSHKVFLIAKSLAVCKEVPYIFRKVR